MRAELTSGKTHVLNVVQVFAQGVPCTTTPCLRARIALGRIGALREGITVNDHPAEQIMMSDRSNEKTLA